MRETGFGAVRRRLGQALIVLAVVESAWLLYPFVRERLAPSEETPAARGARLAGQLGCFGCHGPGGSGGTHNPTVAVGSDASRTWRLLGDEGEVPAFTEQTQMMYVANTDELREYILDGAPRRKREDADYRAKVEASALRMPAYREFVTGAQLEDLVAYLRATSGQILPEDRGLARGGDLARELGCEACHGPLGAGGMPNPGSFKGYVPAFWGADFDELVRDDAELRQWITEGRVKRIAEHPVGRVFFERQVIKMPAYGRFLPSADIDALVAWVRWIRGASWRSQLR